MNHHPWLEEARDRERRRSLERVDREGWKHLYGCENREDEFTREWRLCLRYLPLCVRIQWGRRMHS